MLQARGVRTITAANDKCEKYGLLFFMIEFNGCETGYTGPATEYSAENSGVTVTVKGVFAK
jgi:hypothetical protein